MKRLSSSDSMCDSQSPRGGYTSNLQSVLDYEEEGTTTIGGGEEYSGMMGSLSEKKRRLRVDQVKALEKNFELENKLEPERKTKLAQELGLQPRQVAVWFQNRRARWKTKQLEKDYGLLKSQYDSLRHNFDSLRRDNDSLLQEISKIKAKLNGEEEEEQEQDKAQTENEISIIKEEEVSIPEKLSPIPSSPPLFLEHSSGFNYRRSFTDLRDLLPDSSAAAAASDSCDSSAVLNDETNSTPMDTTTTTTTVVTGKSFLQFVKTEDDDHNDDFLSGEGFFSDEQPPSLHWYSASDHWT